MASQDRQFNAGYVIGSSPTWVGATLPALGQDSTGITDFLGAVLELTDPNIGNTRYKLVKNAGASTAATYPGEVVYYIDNFNQQVSTSFSDAGTAGTPAGIALAAIPIAGYGWVQTDGFMPAVKAGSGTFAYGLLAISDGTAGQVIPVTAGNAPTYPPVGTSLYTTSANWANGTAYGLMQLVLPTSGGAGFIYQATTAGTSGATQPTWPLAVGATVTDGTVVWTAIARTSSYVYVPLQLHVGKAGVN